MRKRYRVISLLVCFLLVLGCFPFTANAASTLTITSPVDWGKVDRENTTLKWTKVDGAANYKLTIVNNSDGGALLTTRNMSMGNTTSYDITSYLQKIPMSDIPSGIKIWVGAYNSSDVLICSGVVGEPSGNYGGITVSAKPSITSGSASSITSNSVKLSVTVNKNYGSAIEDAGFYVGTSSNVSAAKQYSASSIVNNGTMTRTITGLQAGTKYYYWAYAENGIGETISSRSSFTTDEGGTGTESNGVDLTDSRFSKMGSTYLSSTYYSKLKNLSLTGNHADDIVAVAKTQLGYVEKSESENVYASFYSGSGDWCAYFVSWCSGRSEVPNDVITLCANANPGKLVVDGDITLFMSQSKLQNNKTSWATKFPWITDNRVSVGTTSSYSPQKGDLVFFGSATDGGTLTFTHVGIVTENSSGTSVSYIDGNGGSNGEDNVSLQTNKALSGLGLIAYARPAYGGSVAPSSYTITYDYGYGIDGFTAGSDAKVDKMTKQHGQNHVIIDSAYTKTGYKFLGWGVYPDVTTVKYKAGDVYSTNANLYLYAVWEKASCSHSWGSWNSTGSTQHKRTCSLCGEDQTQSHSWGSWGTIGTEQHQRKCSVCSGTQTQSHTWGSWIDYSSSQHKHSCTTCSTTNYEDHYWSGGIVTKEPTQTSTGIRTYICYDCSRTKTETIPMLDEDEHRCTWSTEWSSDEVYHWLALTCGCDGRVNPGPHEDSDGDEICDVCEYHMGQEACDHSWGSWSRYNYALHKRDCLLCGERTYGEHDWDDGWVTVQPTTSSTGIKTYTCWYCEATKDEEMPRLDDTLLSIGDCNGDGEIDFADAILVLKHDAGTINLSDDRLIAADVNADGCVDFVDAILILKYDSGLIQSFPV